jgi:RNA polymerase sigma factor (sigma-70 family)
MTDPARLDELDDAELLRRSRRSSAPFRVVYDRHVERLNAFLERRTGDPAAAFELTAETFAQAWLSRERFANRGEGAAPWLFGIARNVLAASIRAASIERQARRSVGIETAADTVAEPRAEWLAGFDEDLASALRSLPEAQRSVIEMRVLEDRPYAEVAGALGITAGTARVRTFRGLAALRESLAERRRAPVTSVTSLTHRPADAVAPKETSR